MQKPTVGRVVHIFGRHSVSKEHQPEAATIAFVHKDGSINVGGLDAAGMIFAAHNLKLVDEGASEDGLHAKWPKMEAGAPVAPIQSAAPPTSPPATFETTTLKQS